MHGLDCRAVLTVHTGSRRGPIFAGLAVAACVVVGCFSDNGPGELTGVTPTTVPPTTDGSTTGTPTTSAESTSTSDDTTGAPPPSGAAFRLSTLSIVDPHFFLTDMGDPPSCTDATAGLNTIVNADIADAGFSLLIYFAELAPGAEMRLFQGDCTDPGDGSMWTCVKQEGTTQTIFDTENILEGPCRDINPGFFQAVNLPSINDPPPPCVRTQKLDFSVAVSNSAGALFLRDAQLVASPDSLENPTKIPTGVLYGFFPKVSAEDITVEIPLNGAPTLWSVIDVPQCADQHPDQVPSVDWLLIDGVEQPGAWLALNFTAEKIIYEP